MEHYRRLGEVCKFYQSIAPYFEYFENDKYFNEATNYVTRVRFGKRLWCVVGQEGSKLFLVSDLLISPSREYDNSKSKVTWATCSLRKWLNGEFINSQFSGRERAIIQTTKLEDSEDKIFLLSETDVKTYLEKYRICRSGFCRESIGNHVRECHSWWLRTTGNGKESEASKCVTADGQIKVERNREWLCIRPALVLDFSLLYDDSNVMNKYQEYFGDNKEN